MAAMSSSARRTVRSRGVGVRRSCSSASSKPPSGPTATTHLPSGGSRELVGADAVVIGEHQAGAADELRHRHRAVDHRKPRPPALRPGLARHPTEAIERLVLAVAVPADDRARRPHEDDLVGPELGELLHRELRTLALRQRERDGERRDERRLVREVGRRTRGNGTGVDAVHGVGAPPPVAVGGGDDLTGAQPPHPCEVVAVVALDVTASSRRST